MFQTYLNLVMHRVRDAYLVDCFDSNVTVDQVLALVPLECYSRLVLLQLDDQIIVAHKLVLEAKVRTLSNATTANDYPFLIVDISSDDVQALAVDGDKFRSILVALRAHLEAHPHVVSSSHSCAHIVFSSSAFCLPFITGWALGYPVIYYFDSLAESMPNTALSMVELKKTSIVCTAITPANTDIRIDVLEFTYPLLLLDDEHVSARVQELVLARIRSVEAQAAAHADYLTEVLVMTTVVQMPSIIF
jgi:hypothetical protein